LSGQQSIKARLQPGRPAFLSPASAERDIPIMTITVTAAKHAGTLLLTSSFGRVTTAAPVSTLRI
jgi:hypothetical protein